MNDYLQDEYRNCLIHYGILGMKWGKRNGPPYPISSSKRSNLTKKHTKELTDKQKEKILRSPTKTYRNRNKLTEEEITKALKKFNRDRQLKDLSKDELTTAKQFYDSTVMAYAKTIIATGATAAAIYKMLEKIK